MYTQVCFGAASTIMPYVVKLVATPFAPNVRYIHTVYICVGKNTLRVCMHWRKSRVLRGCCIFALIALTFPRKIIVPLRDSCYRVCKTKFAPGIWGSARTQWKYMVHTKATILPRVLYDFMRSGTSSRVSLESDIVFVLPVDLFVDPNVIERLNYWGSL